MHTQKWNLPMYNQKYYRVYIIQIIKYKDYKNFSSK